MMSLLSLFPDYEMNMHKATAGAFLAVLLLALNGGQCLAQTTAKIDWLQGYVSATGRGYARKTGGPMDVDNAIDAARVVAQSELLEAIKGVMIDNQTAVSDLMTEKTETSVRVQGVLHNAMTVGEPRTTEVDDFVVATVEMRVCLYNNGLGCKSDQPLASVLPKSPRTKSKKSESCSLLPNITSTQEILSKITYDTNEPLSLFVINLKGKPLNTESRDFVIRFEAADGLKCLVYGPEQVDPIVRRDRGTAEIFLHAADAERKYGANKIVITPESIDQSNHIVIGGIDAYLINLLNDREHNRLFKEAKFGVAAQD
jgi:hypothetical protein